MEGEDSRFRLARRRVGAASLAKLPRRRGGGRVGGGGRGHGGESGPLALNCGGGDSLVGGRQRRVGTLQKLVAERASWK